MANVLVSAASVYPNSVSYIFVVGEFSIARIVFKGSDSGLFTVSGEYLYTKWGNAFLVKHYFMENPAPGANADAAGEYLDCLLNIAT